MVDLQDNNKWDSVIPKYIKDAISKGIRRQLHKLPLPLVQKWMQKELLDKQWFREARKHIDYPYAHLFDEAPSE